MSKRKVMECKQLFIKKRQQNECISLRENDVFISEYLNSLLGFNGILKKRYSDFHVNEIDLDGNTVHLTDLTVPEFSSFIPEVQCSENDCNLISEDQWNQLLHLLQEGKREDIVRIEVSHLTKSDRQQLHYLIRDRFNMKLFTKTVSEENDHKFIDVGLTQIDDRNSWIDTLPKYLHFVVYKENMDTTEVINMLANKLRIKSNMIMHAGTKDKRGKTVQRMAIRRINVNQFRGISLKNVRLGNFIYKDVPIKLGNLQGNRFRILLRNISIEQKELFEIIDSFKNNGFINYYGLQRFGSNVDSPTYEIGKCLVKKEWLQAIKLILSPRLNDPIDLKEAKKTWEEFKDSKAAFKCLNRNRSSIEGKVLQALADNGEIAYVNALQKIPRNVMLLYGHAYQSLIWNRIISRRIHQFGRIPISGDLIFVNNAKFNSSDAGITEDLTGSDEDVECKSNLVRPLTEDELSDAKIEDIAYPLPGYDVKYPQNVIAEWYRQILSEDGINVEDFKHSSWLFSIPGGYRKMITIPENCEWKIIRYRDVESDLILSDLDILLNRKLSEDGTDGSYKALYLELSLPSSSYATMAVREITKQDTSVSYQSLLTESKD